MPVSLFKRARGGTEQLDIQEAYNIWDWLRTRYNSLETIQYYRNFVHDRDFSLLMNRLLKISLSHLEGMEQEGAKFKIPVPEMPPRELKFEVSINQVTDKFIYRKIFSDMVAQLFIISRIVRTSTTNDRLRKVFVDDLLNHVRHFEMLYKYGKLKAYEDIPPAYKTSSPTRSEPISLAEAFHIWDHLGLRYDQIQLTTSFQGFVHDQDFKLIINQGVELLKKQVGKLEQEAMTFEVVLPERPPSSMKVPIDPETLTDKFMYTTILNGMLDAVDLHMRAVIQTVRNDKLRDLFYELLKEELKTFNNLLRYGKMKGWSKITPIYGEVVT